MCSLISLPLAAMQPPNHGDPTSLVHRTCSQNASGLSKCNFADVLMLYVVVRMQKFSRHDHFTNVIFMQVWLKGWTVNHHSGGCQAFPKAFCTVTKISTCFWSDRFNPWVLIVGSRLVESVFIKLCITRPFLMIIVSKPWPPEANYSKVWFSILVKVRVRVTVGIVQSKNNTLALFELSKGVFYV